MEKLNLLNQRIVEFYEKLSSWEHEVVRGKGLTLPQAHTLEILGDQGEMRMKELAGKMGVTTGTLTVLVDRMEKKGFVRRKPHDKDRRSILVALTARGAELFEDHHELHINLTREITAGMPDEDVEQLTAMLERLCERF